jgi:hypothetical protein
MSRDGERQHRRQILAVDVLHDDEDLARDFRDVLRDTNVRVRGSVLRAELPGAETSRLQDPHVGMPR